MQNKISWVIMFILLFTLGMFAVDRQIKLEGLEKMCSLKESIIQTMLSPPDVLPIDTVWADGGERPTPVKHLPARLLRK